MFLDYLFIVSSINNPSLPGSAGLVRDRPSLRWWSGISVFSLRTRIAADGDEVGWQRARPNAGTDR